MRVRGSARAGCRRRRRWCRCSPPTATSPRSCARRRSDERGGDPHQTLRSRERERERESEISTLEKSVFFFFQDCAGGGHSREERVVVEQDEAEEERERPALLDRPAVRRGLQQSIAEPEPRREEHDERDGEAKVVPAHGERREPVAPRGLVCEKKTPLSFSLLRERERERETRRARTLY